MPIGPLRLRAEPSRETVELLAMLIEFRVRGNSTPELLSRREFKELTAEESTTEWTFKDCGKFWAVLEEIVTVFGPVFVIMTD